MGLMNERLSDVFTDMFSLPGVNVSFDTLNNLSSFILQYSSFILFLLQVNEFTFYICH